MRYGRGKEKRKRERENRKEREKGKGENKERRKRERERKKKEKEKEESRRASSSDLWHSDGPDLSDQEEKSVYATRATRGYQNLGVSPKIQQRKFGKSRL